MKKANLYTKLQVIKPYIALNEQTYVTFWFGIKKIKNKIQIVGQYTSYFLLL